MDWGIVVSVLVALVLFALGTAAVGLALVVPMGRRMKRKMKTRVEAGEMPTCPVPGCAFHEEIETALAAKARSVGARTSGP